jgi:hypothetical protein
MPTYDEPELYEDEWYDEQPPEEAPKRRVRRAGVTPVTVGLAAVLVGAGGFIAGVQVQKGQEDSSSGGTNAAGAFPGGGAGLNRTGGGATAGAPTTGSVTSKKGDVIYVESSDGTTVKVKLTDNSKVTRTAKSEASEIHPGDTVIIQGTKGSSGSVTATSVTAVAKGATSGLRGGFGGGGGFTPPSGATGGGATGGGGAGPAGFGPPPGG